MNAEVKDKVEERRQKRREADCNLIVSLDTKTK
jgi:hypothetical protein